MCAESLADAWFQGIIDPRQCYIEQRDAHKLSNYYLGSYRSVVLLKSTIPLSFCLGSYGSYIDRKFEGLKVEVVLFGVVIEGLGMENSISLWLANIEFSLSLSVLDK